MKMMRYHIVFLRAGIIFLIFVLNNVRAQDPNFSQFISSPLSINPALSGSSDADWRIASVVRRQWIGNVSPYSTQTISVDGRIKNIDDQRYIGIGGMLLAENAMDGLFKTNLINLNATYHQALDENGNGLTASLGVVSSNTRVDLAGLTFDQQLSSIGFDRALPTGETSIGKSTGFTSACAGLLYTYDTEYSFLNLGVSGYRFVASNRSLMNDASIKTAPRYTVHADFGTALTDNFSATFSALHLIQDGLSVTSLGAVLGFISQSGDYTDKVRMFNAGVFYRLNDAVSPYLGYIYNNFQFGLSYDVNAATGKGAAATYKSVELSFVYKKFLPQYRKRPGRYHSPY
jgi:type IX secretion system PorP/SprF family membrane protein